MRRLFELRCTRPWCGEGQPGFVTTRGDCCVFSAVLSCLSAVLTFENSCQRFEVELFSCVRGSAILSFSTLSPKEGLEKGAAWCTTINLHFCVRISRRRRFSGSRIWLNRRALQYLLVSEMDIRSAFRTSAPLVA